MPMKTATKTLLPATLALAMLLACGFAQAQSPVGATLKKIRDSGSITYGHREASFGFSYLDGGSKPVGYSTDICNRIPAAIKTELKMPQIEVKYQNVTSQNRIPLVTDGTVDIECGSTTNLVERQQMVA